MVEEKLIGKTNYALKHELNTLASEFTGKVGDILLKMGNEANWGIGSNPTYNLRTNLTEIICAFMEREDVTTLIQKHVTARLLKALDDTENHRGIGRLVCENPVLGKDNDDEG